MDLDEVAEWEEAADMIAKRPDPLAGLESMVRPAYMGRRDWEKPGRVVVDPRTDPHAMDALRFMAKQGRRARKA